MCKAYEYRVAPGIYVVGLGWVHPTLVASSLGPSSSISRRSGQKTETPPAVLGFRFELPGVSDRSEHPPTSICTAVPFSQRVFTSRRANGSAGSSVLRSLGLPRSSTRGLFRHNGARSSGASGFPLLLPFQAAIGLLSPRTSSSVSRSVRSPWGSALASFSFGLFFPGPASGCSFPTVPPWRSLGPKAWRCSQSSGVPERLSRLLDPHSSRLRSGGQGVSRNPQGCPQDSFLVRRIR